MLEMKSQCETCSADLPHSAEAYICSYECTFCGDCTDKEHQQVCPNCKGELVRRPKRKQSVG